MDLPEILDELAHSNRFRHGLVHAVRVPAEPARHAPFPESLDPRLVETLRRRGIDQLYTHQARAVTSSLEGKDLVVVTPTASGKTLCYNLPVLHQILQDPEARALYLFPTKALSQDQLAELHEITEGLDTGIKTYTYDGDTPSNVRRTVRLAAHIVVTNPDMLHAGILPHHTRWVKLFENLRYVVIDEVHQYRGVFGSHLANVMRRLERICRFYGSRPRFIACSATIRNPHELATQLLDRPLELVDRNGAPRGERHLWLYNPPIVNQELGVRRSAIKEAAALAVEFIRRGVQTIVFARGRVQVEVLLTYIRNGLRKHHKDPSLVRGYRGGYLPNQRREIERGLRSRKYLAVVSTNALELGIDIGGMDACIVTGFPGSVSSTLQQWGRAGRRQGPSLAVLVGTSNPLDQFLLDHPEYLMGAAPEAGIIHPGNLVIRVNQIKCAAFELPFEAPETFGSDSDQHEFREVLGFLEDHRILRRVENRWHWMTDVYPAQDVSLRTASTENFVIVDLDHHSRAIGDVDLFSAPFMVHEQAIYLHEEKQYIIERLDWTNRIAHARPVEVDYYTDAEGKSEVKVLDCFQSEAIPGGTRSLGEVAVTTLPVLFKKIRFHTHENLGWGKITLPELEIQTMSYWLALDPAAIAPALAPLDARGRAAGPPLGTDPEASLADPAGPDLPVGALVRGAVASRVADGIAVGPGAGASGWPGAAPHGQDVVSGGIKALSHVLGHVLPLFVLCDRSDLRVVAQVNAPFTRRPTIFIYDGYPGGVGLAERVFENHAPILEAARDVLLRCRCTQGCPSCVGPPLSVGETGKAAALALLEVLGCGPTSGS